MKYTRINKEDKEEEYNNKEKDLIIGLIPSNVPVNNNNNKNGNIFLKICNKKFYLLFLFVLFLYIFLSLLLYNYEYKFMNTILETLNTIKSIKNKKELNDTELFKLRNRTKEYMYKYEKFDNREESFNKAKNFLNKTIEGILLHEIPSVSFENPLVSAIIPVYNSRRYIGRAIKSIQNQNINNTEIILINDHSTDDTLSYIQNIQNFDPRIKVINNKKNMGIFYSRCIGTLSANGKYIFPLDNDDMFLDEDVFQTITNIAENGLFDIVEFKGVKAQIGDGDIFNRKRVDTRWSVHPLNMVLFQPELGGYQAQPGKTLRDVQE